MICEAEPQARAEATLMPGMGRGAGSWAGRRGSEWVRGSQPSDGAPTGAREP